MRHGIANAMPTGAGINRESSPRTELVEFERGEHRHGAAAVVAAGHRLTIEIVAPRRARAGARADIDHRAIVFHVGGEPAPCALDGGTIGPVEPSEAHAPRHRA